MLLHKICQKICRAKEICHAIFPKILLLILCTPLAQAQQTTAEKTRILQSLEVLGDRQPDEPGSLSLLNQYNIELLRADHPAELLNTLPGINIQMNSGQENLPAIRSPVLTLGSGQGSILLLENGVPLRSATLGNINALFELPIENAHLIEVIRGPGSARYGSNALHGLVNVIAPEPLDELRYRASASGSHRGRWQIKAMGQGLIPGIRNMLNMSAQIDTGWRESAGLNEQKISFQMARDIQGWAISTYLAAFRLDQQTAGFLQDKQCADDPLEETDQKCIDEGPNAYDNYDSYKDATAIRSNPNPDAFRNAWSARLHVRAEHDLFAGRLILTPYSSFQGMHFSQHFLPNASEEKNGQYVGGILVRYERSLGPLDLNIGISGEGADSWLLETQAGEFGFFPADQRFPTGKHYDYRVSAGSNSAYLEALWHIDDDLRMLAAIRGEGHYLTYRSNIPVTDPLPEGENPNSQSRFQVIPNRSDVFWLLIPKFGVIWSGMPDTDIFSNTEIFLNYSAGGRVPQASDLYRLQSQQQAGDFAPENIHSIEAGSRGYILDRAEGRIGYDLSGYWMYKTNVHFRDSDRRNFSGGKTQHYGIDAGLNAEIGPLQTGLSVSWGVHEYKFDLASNNIAKGNRVDTAPEWLIDLSAGYYSKRFSLRGDLEYIGSYFTDASNQHSYPGHVVLHLRGNWQLTDRAEIFLNMRNLLSTRYADRADFAFGNERYFPGEPFNATFGIRFNHM